MYPAEMGLTYCFNPICSSFAECIHVTDLILDSANPEGKEAEEDPPLL
jgi:hypothetical protein